MAVRRGRSCSRRPLAHNRPRPLLRSTAARPCCHAGRRASPAGPRPGPSPKPSPLADRRIRETMRPSFPIRAGASTPRRRGPRSRGRWTHMGGSARGMSSLHSLHRLHRLHSLHSRVLKGDMGATQSGRYLRRAGCRRPVRRREIPELAQRLYHRSTRAPLCPFTAGPTFRERSTGTPQLLPT